LGWRCTHTPQNGIPRVGAEIPPYGIIINLVAASIDGKTPPRKIPITNDRFATVRVLWVNITPLNLSAPNASDTSQPAAKVWVVGVVAVCHTTQSRRAGFGAHNILVLVGTAHPLEPGDKLTSKSGCKVRGVTSVTPRDTVLHPQGVAAALIPGHLLPYSLDGSVPTLVVNPDSIAARKLTSQLLETWLMSAVVARCTDEGALEAVLHRAPWLAGFRMPSGAMLPDMVAGLARGKAAMLADVKAYCAAKGVAEEQVGLT
jgi:DNA-directed RNA polymerase beta subunit